jgi:VWFA-related protein
MTFDTTVRLHQDYTDDPAVLAQAAQMIGSGGSTALYDALCEAARDKLAGQSGRRVIVIMSDGIDNSSRVSQHQALEVAQKNDVLVYAVSTNRIQGLVLPDQKFGDANLSVLAAETGGRVLNPSKIQDVGRSFQQISKEIRSQYSLAYRPSNNRRDGSYREIRIVPANRTYNVRARRGYFAPG